MRLLDDFASELTRFVTGGRCADAGGLVKRHSSEFGRRGEFSFPWCIAPWRSSLGSCGSATSVFDVDGRTDSLETRCERLKLASREWSLRISECSVIGDRVHVFLDRKWCVARALSRRFELVAKTDHERRVHVVKVDAGDDVTEYRLRSLSSATEKLAALNGYELDEHDAPGSFAVGFTTERRRSSTTDRHEIYCAPVLSDETKSKQKLSADEYSKKRTTDMKLNAQHKYRVIVTNEPMWNESLMQLGRAAVMFDLLQVKPSRPVYVSMTDSSFGSSKGACFVLYNAARVSSIIDTFERKIREGVYPPMPDIEQIDYSTLTDEDEWILVFNFIMTYGSMLHDCFVLESGKCIVSPHILCSYLSCLVGRFSIYYRRIKILLEPREHLLPKIYARIRLLTIIRHIIAGALSVFDIEILAQM